MHWQIFAPQEDIAQTNPFTKVKLLDSKLWLMITFFGAQSGLYYAGMTWLSPYLIAQGLTTQASNLYLSLFATLQMIFSFVLPVLINRLNKLKEGLYTCLVIATVGVLGLLLFPAQPLFFVILAATGLSVLFTIALTFPVLFSESTAQASVYTSYVQMFGYIIGGLLPILIGQVIDLTGNYSLIWYIALTLISLVFWSGNRIFARQK